MQVKKELNTTLGDLIAAITDEVTRVAGATEQTEALVSYVVADLFASGQVRLQKDSVLPLS
jgi:hypothetical protein